MGGGIEKVEWIRDIGFVVILLTAAIKDYKTMEIPDWIHGAGIAWWFLFWISGSSERMSDLREGLMGGVLVSGSLFMLALVMDQVLRRESLGGGDIKLLFVTGLYLGPVRNFLTLFFSSVIGIFIGMTYRRRMYRKIKRKNSEPSDDNVPFAPAIAVSSVICLLAGDQLIGWYLSLL